MKIGNICILVAALIAGAAAGYCVGRYVTPSPAPAEPSDEKPRQSQRAGVGNDAEKKILRERVAAQDARIRELEAQGRAEEGDGEKPAETAVREGERPPRRDFRAEMERLRVEEPERYAQITNRMARFRQQNLERAQSKMDFLASIDTSTMPQAAREAHTALMDLIERRAEIDDKFRNFGAMTDEERRAAFDEMREVDGDINRLNKTVRSNLLRQTAKELGLKGEASKDFVDTVKGIIDATESGFGHHGRPGGPPRGPGGGHRGGR